MMKKIFTHWTLAFITLAVLMTWGLKDPFVKETARLKSFDLIQKYDTPTMSEDVIIVEIDEKSIEQNGQWPWKRTVLADVIWRLREAGAGIIVLPILFSEEDRLGGDMDLAQALVQNGIVIAQVGTTQTNKNAVPRGVAKIGDPLPWLFEWPGMLGPIPLLGDNVDGVGVVNTTPEIDGVVRRLPLLMRVGDEVYPSVALEVIRVAVGDPSYQVKASEGGVIALRVPKFKTVKTDQYARIWLRWNKQFKTISITDDFASVAGKTVIIGNTAQGISTIIATPNGEQYSHTAMAVSLQTVLNGENIVRMDTATFLEYVAAGVLAVIIIVLAGFAPYWLVGAVLLTVWSGTAYGAYFYFVKHLQLWDASWIILVTTITGFHAVFNRFVKEFSLKQQIKKQFGTYLSPDMVAQLQKNPDLLKLGGESRNLSIMFTDVRGFTSISEHYGEDVQGLTKIMNRYMTAMTREILNNKGTIDKYIGDAQMAFWNAPLDDWDHAENAVWTGIKMLDSLDKFNEEVQQEGIPAFGMGLGINTAEVVVGNMGSDQRFDYTCLGDGVNLAARLEGQSKTYGVRIVLGPETARRVKDKINVFELDCIAVKGKTIGVKIYTVAKESEHHRQFLASYYAGDWEEAIKRLETANQFHEDMTDYYSNMKARIESGKPKDWDGTFKATTK
jgi:adenylate cyclase